MRRVLRLVVAGALVVILVAASAAACVRGDRATLPSSLVGRWTGGAHGNGPWRYEFTGDGHYRVWVLRGGGTENRGTVTVEDDTITFSNGGAPVTQEWAVVGDVLTLDGERYVRG